jgi:hypothetical protein
MDIKSIFGFRSEGKSKSVSPNAGVCESIGVKTKLKLVVTNPRKFFKVVENEKGYECPIVYYLFLLLIQVIMSNIFIILMPAGFLLSLEGFVINPLLVMLIVESFRDLIMINLSVGISIVVTFLVAFFVHCFVRLFKGSGGIEGTFKAIIYSYTPNMLLTVASALLVAVFIAISLINTSISLIGLVPVIIPFFTIFFFLWAIYLEVRGLAVFHKMSQLKALLTVVLSGIILLVVVFIATMGNILVFT